MKHIFDVQADDLDLVADPNRIVEVQGLVRELLQSDETRALGIKQQIVQEHGAFALPGLISATYTLQDYLRTENARRELADVIVLLTGDNPTLQRFLLSTGITDSPFNTSRMVCETALEQISNIEWVPSDLENLRIAITRAFSDQDAEGVVILLGTWLKLSPESAYGEAMHIVEKWLADRDTAPVQVFALVNRCIQYCPKRTSETLERMLKRLPRDDKGAIEPIRDNLRFDRDTVQEVLPTIDRLVRTERGPARPHEGVVAYGIGNYLREHPEDVPQLELAARQCSEKTQGFWWMAVSHASEHCPPLQQYLIKSVVAPQADTFFDQAALQLVFLHRRRSGAPKWIKEAYQKAVQGHSQRMEDAEETYERIRDATQTRRGGYLVGGYDGDNGPGELG